MTGPARQRRGPGAEEIALEAGHRWSPPLYRTGRGGDPPHACPSRHPDPVRAARRRRAQVRRPVTVLPALPQPQAGRCRAGPANHRARRPADGLGRTRPWPRVLAAAIPGGCNAEPVQRHSGRAESGRAPPCMRWRGPARPRRTGWPVAWPCRRRAPPAGARYPREGPVSRLLPRSRGRPQVVPVSDGKTFLLHKRAPRKSPRPAISGFPAIREMIHRERAVTRTSRQLSTGLFTAYPQPEDMNRRTPGQPGLLTPDVRPIVHIGWRIIARATGSDGAQMA